MEITAKIEGIKYKYSLYRGLNTYSETQVKNGMPNDGVFYLNIGGEIVALSYWVSPKRTRSYPYARVYDSLNYSGKKITVIPVIKDEGFSGDRDYLQWDTVSLMSLLGVYVVIAYYSDASLNNNYENKITNQKFDMHYVIEEIREILTYRSDALHWNLREVDKLKKVGNLAIKSYKEIFEKYGIGKTHDFNSAYGRINKIMNDKEIFMGYSRKLAGEAQNREIQTTQLNESIRSGYKSKIMIKNFLGGEYYFTVDEAHINRDNLFLIEAKNSNRNALPSCSDIKDGLIKMILYSNLSNVYVNGIEYTKQPALKLTGVDKEFTVNEKSVLDTLEREARDNSFHILLNDKWII